jgi:hypothetical protein
MPCIPHRPLTRDDAGHWSPLAVALQAVVAQGRGFSPIASRIVSRCADVWAAGDDALVFRIVLSRETMLDIGMLFQPGPPGDHAHGSRCYSDCDSPLAHALSQNHAARLHPRKSAQLAVGCRAGRGIGDFTDIGRHTGPAGQTLWRWRFRRWWRGDGVLRS